MANSGSESEEYSDQGRSGDFEAGEHCNEDPDAGFFFKPADCFQYKQDIDEEFVRDGHREVYLAFYEVGTVLRVRQMRWEQFI